MKEPHDKTDCAIARVCLELLPETGWDSLELKALAHHAGMPLKTISDRIAKKSDIIPMIVQLIDAETEALAGRQDINTPREDRLFDVLMSRFEALQKYRDAVLLLASHIKRTPELAYVMYIAQTDSMRRMYQWIQPSNKKNQSPYSHYILLIIYNFAFVKWARDSSPDLSFTMTSLNYSIRTKLTSTLFAERHSVPSRSKKPSI